MGNLRIPALEWWNKLAIPVQQAMATKHFPNHPTICITTSSMRIEEMYKITRLAVMDKLTTKAMEKST